MKRNNNISIDLISPVTLVLFLVFFFAKIFDKIDWSWWWIFSPLWIPLALLLGIVTIFGIIYLTVSILDKLF